MVSEANTANACQQKKSSELSCPELSKSRNDNLWFGLRGFDGGFGALETDLAVGAVAERLGLRNANQ